MKLTCTLEKILVIQDQNWKNKVVDITKVYWQNVLLQKLCIEIGLSNYHEEFYANWIIDKAWLGLGPNKQKLNFPY